jgi:hypothetical protein
VRAIIKIITIPNSHESMAAGPAVWAAFIAPNSQPDPMIEPTLANSSPIKPTSRLRLPSRCCTSDDAMLPPPG